MNRIVGAVWAALISLTPSLHAELAKASSSKTFAVFAISYNEDNNLVVGGVMGTAFFISETKAVTAYHVLQPVSFKPNPGFQHKKIYLIHENEPPIEIRSSQARFVTGRDQTLIEISPKSKIPTRLVYQMETSVQPEANVITEGFEANTSVGPVIVRDGKHVRIDRVPSLQRRELRGMVLRKANIQIDATDIRMNGVNCLQLSYEPIVGFSGGPVISSRGRVVAMNSFAEPITRARTWAVSLTRDVGLSLF